MKRLQEDGRIPSKTLGDEVGVTATAASYRMNTLLDKCIKKIVAIPHNAAFGYHVETMCMIALNEQTEKAFDSFISHLSYREEIRECKLLTGSVDFYVRFVAKDNYHVEDIMEFIRQSPFVNRIQFYNTLETKIDKIGVPL